MFGTDQVVQLTDANTCSGKNKSIVQKDTFRGFHLASAGHITSGGYFQICDPLFF